MEKLSGYPIVGSKKQEIEDVLQKNHGDISQRVSGYFREKAPLIERFFPGKFRRLIENERLREARTELDFTNQLLHLSTQFNLQLIGEKYETWLKVSKVNYREQFYGFVTSKVKSLQETILEREAEFFSLMRKRYALIEKNNDMPSMVALYRTKIEKEQESYFEWLEFIMEDFQNIVKEKITDYERISNH